ncbi:cupin domain-containing protein [Phenylobacterium soli]|uniref:Cupin n=1 Tax=Phenylobacterium soli TaxID=2170551 RepID=A0A328AAK1_9CAUL|nr:cupin domain-containing protein [Phenylobacterium soli]RAK51640.1 cupin [Phenylobacterium soli]
MIRALLLAAAVAAPAPVTTPLKSLEATAAGQPITPPPGPVEVKVSQTDIPAGGQIPPHKHPWPRYVYVISGRIQVDNLVTGQSYELKAGDASIDPVDQWHQARALDGAPARLIAIDQVPPGATNLIRKAP